MSKPKFPDVAALSKSTPKDAAFMEAYNEQMTAYRKADHANGTSFSAQYDRIWDNLGNSINRTIAERDRVIDGIHARQLKRAEDKAEENWRELQRERDRTYEAECRERDAQYKSEAADGLGKIAGVGAVAFAAAVAGGPIGALVAVIGGGVYLAKKLKM